jgi:hypothetical protein
MTKLPESRHEQLARHAHECLDLVTNSTDSATRITFAAMAVTWLKLAHEVPPIVGS